MEPLRAVRDHLSELVERVEREHERVVVTRNGRAAAVLTSPEDLAELEETLAVLGEARALSDVQPARTLPRAQPAAANAGGRRHPTA